jgi:hypothetical protein
MREFVLCPQCGGPTNPCCPVIKTNEDLFFIEDDYGQSIKIKKEDLPNLIKDVNKILSMHGSGMDSKR